MTTPRVDRALRALIVGFAVLAIAVISSIWLTQQQQQSTALVNHTLEVQKRLTTVL